MKVNIDINIKSSIYILSNMAETKLEAPKEISEKDIQAGVAIYSVEIRSIITKGGPGFCKELRDAGFPIGAITMGVLERDMMDDKHSSLLNSLAKEALPKPGYLPEMKENIYPGPGTILSIRDALIWKQALVYVLVDATVYKIDEDKLIIYPQDNVVKQLKDNFTKLKIAGVAHMAVFRKGVREELPRTPHITVRHRFKPDLEVKRGIWTNRTIRFALYKYHKYPTGLILPCFAYLGSNIAELHA